MNDMNLETKYKLIEKLMQTEDEAILQQVHVILESIEIIGYELDGSPITKRNCLDKLKSAQKRVSSGDYITQEDLENEMEKW